MMLIRCWYSTPRKRRRTWKGIATAALTRRWVAPLVVAAAAADTRSTRMGRRGRGGDGRVPTRILPIIIAITRKAARAGFLSTLFDQEVGHGGGCLGPTYCIAFAFVFPTMEMPNAECRIIRFGRRRPPSIIVICFRVAAIFFSFRLKDTHFGWLAVQTKRKARVMKLFLSGITSGKPQVVVRNGGKKIVRSIGEDKCAKWREHHIIMLLMCLQLQQEEDNGQPAYLSTTMTSTSEGIIENLADTVNYCSLFSTTTRAGAIYSLKVRQHDSTYCLRFMFMVVIVIECTFLSPHLDSLELLGYFYAPNSTEFRTRSVITI